MISDEDAQAMIEAARLRSQTSDWCTIEEAATLLGVSVRSIRRRQAAGEMPPRVRRSRRLEYRIDDIKNLLNRG
jgi:excisionase family DNA binding protein